MINNKKEKLAWMHRTSQNPSPWPNNIFCHHINDSNSSSRIYHQKCIVNLLVLVLVVFDRMTVGRSFLLLYNNGQFPVRNVNSICRRNYGISLILSRYPWFWIRCGGYAGGKGYSNTHHPVRTKFLTRSISSSSTSRLHALTPNSIEFQDFLKQHDNVVLTYITDIEGDKPYLDRYVETSKVLTFKTRELSINNNELNDNNILPYSFPYKQYIDFIDSNSLLVFGGDIWDKGGYDLYVTRQLLDLKRRYPYRVFWVLGNRDINKLRMSQELGLRRPNNSATNSSSPITVPYHPGLTWFRNSGRVGDPKGPLPSMIPGERLKWILGNTMGSPNAFEHRRQELAWERLLECSETSRPTNNDIATISDLDVVQSYQESCHPNGELGLFLSQGLLAARIGPTLFVHGSLPLTSDVMENAKQQSRNIWDDLSFCMPWISKSSTAVDYNVRTIDDWINALNQFYYNNIEKWKQDIARRESKDQDNQYVKMDKKSAKNAIWAYRAGYDNGPPYSGLIQYGMGMTPDGKKNPTVVYNSFTPEGMPKSFFPIDFKDDNVAQVNDDHIESDVAICTRDFFERSSIQLILTGHKPQGDQPTSIRVGDSSWVICADTSYSGDTIWWNGKHVNGVDQEKQSVVSTLTQQRNNLGRGNALSFRGDVAVSEVLVCLSDHGKSLDSVKYHGVLSDGTEYESVNLLDAAYNTTVGQVAPDYMVPSPIDSPHQGRWWTKSIFSDGLHVFHAGEGFNVWNYVVPIDESDKQTSK